MAIIEEDLYRACRKNNRSPKSLLQSFEEQQGSGSLYPDFVGFTRKDGRFRAPDVKTITDAEGNTWVLGIDEFPKRTQGTSLNTAPGKFGYTTWFYFVLPQDTQIPASLAIEQTGADHDHYSILCKTRMRKDSYEGALDSLARAALAKSVEQKRQSLQFE